MRKIDAGVVVTELKSGTECDGVMDGRNGVTEMRTPLRLPLFGNHEPLVALN